MNSRVNMATEKSGKIPQQRVTSQRRTRRISCKPESRHKRDYPKPMKQTVPITQGDGIPPTALKGSCMGKHHATAHSPSQSTASTGRKGDSKRNSLKGFWQPSGAPQPTSVVLLQAFFFFLNKFRKSDKPHVDATLREAQWFWAGNVTSQNSVKEFFL